jgi:hypothetical protein
VSIQKIFGVGLAIASSVAVHDLVSQRAFAAVDRFVASQTASADGQVDGGALTIVQADDRTKPIERAKSATVFSFELPADAQCPGDSANDQWRIQSFIIPATVDPASLKYGVNDPEGEGNWSLYGIDTRPFVNELTQQNAQPGQPGIIDDIRPLSFGVFPPGTLPDGEYTIGVACTFFAEPAAIYWHTNIVVSADADDEPGRMTWRLASVPPTDPSAGGELRRWPWPTVVGLLALSGVIAVVFLRQTRRRRELAPRPHPDAPAPVHHLVRATNQEKLP